MNIRTWGIMATTVFFLATSGMAFGIVAGPSARTTFFAVLVGGNEVSNEAQANVGDPNGRGSATIIIPNARTLCFATLVTGIDTPVAAHVHNGLAGRNGPIVVTLTAPDQGNPGNSSGCVTNLGPALLNAITQNPGAFYVNVHTGLFPDGALRGQLF
ncbi:MAG: CHRD domain-containing protein [Gammaproteobacteria bacterium]